MNREQGEWSFRLVISHGHFLECCWLELTILRWLVYSCYHGFVFIAGPSLFGSAQSAGKVLRKAEVALSISPRKLARVLKRLIDQYVPDDPSTSQSASREGKGWMMLSSKESMNSMGMMTSAGWLQEKRIRSRSTVSWSRNVICTTISVRHPTCTELTTLLMSSVGVSLQLLDPHKYCHSKRCHTLSVSSMKTSDFWSRLLKEQKMTCQAPEESWLISVSAAKRTLFAWWLKARWCVGCKEPEKVYQTLSFSEVTQLQWYRWSTVEGRSLNTN